MDSTAEMGLAVADRVEELRQELAKITNNLARISRQLETGIRVFEVESM